jgi:hypothetical protein
MRSALEAAMIIFFGISWPASVYKTVKTKNVKGKSLLFLCLVFTGYLFGIAAKALFDLNYVIVFYIVNLLFVGTDIFFYFKYRKSAPGA